MILTYIWHDCFVLTTDSCKIVFDYWKSPSLNSEEFTKFLKGENPELPVYVLVSHHHKDHYTTRIFEWTKIFPCIHFILSADTAKFSRHILNPDSLYGKAKPTVQQVTVLKPGEGFHDDNIAIEAFGSTDIGNSYIVKTGGKIYFHAGDLNAWIWKDESTDEEVRNAIEDFMTIVRKIGEKYPIIDYAMFPVDSRIGSEYFTGARIFVREIFVRHFFPMHFGLGETVTEQLKYQHDAARISDYANPERGEYICLMAPYSSFSSADGPE